MTRPTPCCTYRPAANRFGRSHDWPLSAHPKRPASYAPSEAAYGVRELVPAFSRATAVSAVPLLPSYLARSLYAEPFREHLSPTPQPAGEAAYGVRKLVTAFWPTAACKHPSSRVPISQLPTPISDTLCPRARNRRSISLCSLCSLLFILFFVFVFASIVSQLRSPRST